MFVRILLLVILSFMEVSAGTPPFDDDVYLARELMEDFTSDECRTLNAAKAFKKCFGIPDDQLWRALMIVWQEAKARRLQGASGSRDEIDGRRMLSGAMLWFPLVADARAKQLLLDVAATRDEDGFLRTTALASFLIVANVEETRDVLLKFLVEKATGIDKLSVYAHARSTYDQLSSLDDAKRRAIITALIVAAASEDGKIGFVEVDRILSMRSETYRHSRERLALLRRHSLAPPTQNLYTDIDLKNALEESRRYKIHTSVNTNAALLRAHDFSHGQQSENTEVWGGILILPSPEIQFAPRGVSKKSSVIRLPSAWVVVAAGSAILASAVAGAVSFKRWRKMR